MTTEPATVTLSMSIASSMIRSMLWFTGSMRLPKVKLLRMPSHLQLFRDSSKFALSDTPRIQGKIEPQYHQPQVLTIALKLIKHL